MLMRQQIISQEDGDAVLGGLDAIRREIADGDFRFDPALEDIHMNIEARLFELIGDAAGRLHTARSRNDQVATDLKLWVRDSLDGLDGDLEDLQAVLIDLAEAHAGAVMPGFTHLQLAQPVTSATSLLAYAEMFGRDRERIKDCRRRLTNARLAPRRSPERPFPSTGR